MVIRKRPRTEATTATTEEQDSSLKHEHLCQKARRLWLFATEQKHLDNAEKLYRAVLSREARRRAKGEEQLMDECDVAEARKRFFLLVCQAGRDDELVDRMKRQGFVVRLGRSVLNYQEQPLTPLTARERCPCRVFDGVLDGSSLATLSAAYVPQDAPYWTVHGYCVEPPTPYFSYVLPLGEDMSRFGALGTLALAVREATRQGFGDAAANRVKYAEVWAHNRPHASGHQMHFDSDDEGRGGIRNPVVGSIFYLTSGVGGPSLVTDQKFGAEALATTGWFCWPSTNRLVVFDGKVLHGVVPGKGFRKDTGTSHEGRRVTLMVALWEHIQVRDEPVQGSARPYPSLDREDQRVHAPWVQQLCSTAPEKQLDPTRWQPMAPVKLDHIWETLEGEKWDSTRGMPSYDEAFQGF